MSEKSIPPVTSEINGMMRSLTTEFTMAVNAVPMTTANGQVHDVALIDELLELLEELFHSVPFLRACGRGCVRPPSDRNSVEDVVLECDAGAEIVDDSARREQGDEGGRGHDDENLFIHATDRRPTSSMRIARCRRVSPTSSSTIAKTAPSASWAWGAALRLPALDGIECELEGPVGQQPVFFSFNRFDAENPSPTDELFEAFPRLKFMLPEVILVEDDRGAYLQVNSLSPVYPGRIARFARQAAAAPRRNRRTIPFKLEPDSRDAWRANVEAALDAIGRGRISKVVLSRRQRLEALEPFSSKDLLVNLIDGSARGTVLLYRYADVFFCGCTPELLVRKRGNEVESMCLAGTCPAGATEEERARLADELMADAKNRAEHDHVVRFIREVFNRTCYDVDVPAQPGILPLTHVQHLCTPARARMLEGVDLGTMKDDLHPTPAVAGTPVGEAQMLIRSIEAYNRGFFAGACGYVDGAGNGEFPWRCAPACSTARWAGCTPAAASSRAAWPTTSTTKSA